MNTLFQHIKPLILKCLLLCGLLLIVPSTFAQGTSGPCGTPPFPPCSGSGTGGGTPAQKVLIANSDSLTVANPNGGSIPILANDTADNIFLTPMDLMPSGDLRVEGITNDAGLGTNVSLDSNGVFSVYGSPVAGTYTLSYKLCQPMFSNCVFGTIHLTITATPISAAADTASITPAATVVTVLTNDTVNGAVATSATAVVSIVSDGGLTGLAVSPYGQLLVPARSPNTTRTPTYKICEAASPTNCSAAVTVSLTTLAGPVTVADAATLTAGTGGTVNILANDTFNGVQATPSNVTAQLVTPVTGFSINGAGQLVVAPTVAVGTYPVAYKICDNAVPTSCSASVNATVTVTGLPIAVADTATLTAGTGGTVNILANDTFNGMQATSSNVTAQLVTPVTGFSINGAGQLVVAPTVAAGTYPVAYKICDSSAPTSCSTSVNATVTVTVTVTGLPIAVADATTLTAGTGGTVNILANDTFNGVQATPSNVTAQLVTAVTGFSINGAGQLVVAPTVAAGTYPVAYKICNNAAPTSCSTSVNATVTVTGLPIAVADAATLTVGTGGTVNILANDTFNGVQATPSNVTAQLVTAVTGFSINGAGQLVVAPTVAAGTYPVAYKICDNAAPTSCSASVNATVTVALLAGGTGLVARDDAITMPVAGGLLNVLTNDTYNSIAVNPSTVAITLVANGGIAGASISNQGLLSIPSSLLPTSYVLTYNICLIAMPATCATAKVSIVISTTITSAVRKAPSVSGPANSTINIITAGQSPISFGTGGPVAPGSISDALSLSGVRLSFGDRPGGLTYINLRATQDIPSFNALLFYSGSGQLNARWEVIQPGDADPNEFDLTPEDSLTMAQRAQRHTYTFIERATAYLAPIGSYQLMGPSASRLPKSRLGTHRILLRFEATGNSGTRAFYIPFITYRVLSEPIVETPSTGITDATSGIDSNTSVKSRFTANTNVTDYASIGELNLGASFVADGGLKTATYAKRAPLVGFESINLISPKAGQQLSSKEDVKLAWEAAKQAAVEFWHVEVKSAANNDSLVVTRVAKKTDYVVAPTLSNRLPRDQALRWRVMGVSKEGFVVATSPWLFFTVTN